VGDEETGASCATDYEDGPIVVHSVTVVRHRLQVKS